MERVNKILNHIRYKEYLEKNRMAEEGRRFCHHDMGHFLDVARLAMIFNLQQGLSVSKEMIYAAALLHDIGRWKQYEDGTPHEKASALFAPEILAESGFTKEESEQILSAILNHRNAAIGQDETLDGILYRADKMSRSCFCCEAERECDWKGTRKIGNLDTEGRCRKAKGRRRYYIMRIGSRDFDTKHHCYIMGILNVTPDSFSDGGKFQDMDQALFHVEEMIREGMDIVDIGGESSRPGHTKISAQEEIGRVVPVIENLKRRFDIPVSLDTCKGDVAKAGISAGADLINDIRGLKYDDKMAQVIAEAEVPCCLMHNRDNTVYKSFITDVIHDLQESVSLAKKAGIADDKIILDPGVGFGKTYEQNLEIIAKLEKLHTWGYPLLLGCSRKSVIGLTLDLPVSERLEGTLVTTAVGVLKGCSFIRVHDVKENARALRMAEAVRDYCSA